LDKISLPISTSSLEEIQKNNYISYLIKTHVEASVTAINNSIEKELYEKKIEKIEKRDPVTIEQITEQKKELEGILEKIMMKLNEISKKSNILNQEYKEKAIDGAITVIRPPTFDTKSFISIQMILTLSFVISIFVSVFLVLFIEYIKNSTRKNNN